MVSARASAGRRSAPRRDESWRRGSGHRRRNYRAARRRPGAMGLNRATVAVSPCSARRHDPVEEPVEALARTHLADVGRRAGRSRWPGGGTVVGHVGGGRVAVAAGDVADHRQQNRDRNARHHPGQPIPAGRWRDPGCGRRAHRSATAMAKAGLRGEGGLAAGAGRRAQRSATVTAELAGSRMAAGRAGRGCQEPSGVSGKPGQPAVIEKSNRLAAPAGDRGGRRRRSPALSSVSTVPTNDY